MVEIWCRRYPQVGIHGRVVHELGKDIVRGFFRPLEKLPDEATLTDRFKSSRTALREALRVLAAKGLLEARQRAGTIVRAKPIGI
ncbi:MAG: FadR family transcriptional regulator [Sneathiella sp.]|nr:FadR family transcriptional regulator [Sneathiella sp.]